MQLFDPRTVIVLTGIMSGMMALVLNSLRRSYPQSIRGLKQWSLALSILFLAGGLTAGRGFIPDLLSLSLSNFLLFYGLYIAYAGTQLFFGQKPQPTAWLALIAAVVLFQAWYTYVAPSYAMRLHSANLIISCLFGSHAWLVSRQGTTTFSRRLVFAVMVTMTLVPLVRLLTASIAPTGDDVLSDSPFQLLYVTSFALSVLLFSIGAVLMATDQLRGELEHLATHDSLTNALNRRRMNEHCQQELDRSKRSGRSLAVLVMDLDHFKAINDTHGHQAGDKVLVDFVAKVQSLLRQPDRLGRFGGEEFVVLLPETGLDDAVAVAERIRQVSAVAGEGPSCSVSIGVSESLSTGDSIEALLARADAAMYRSKANGRNRVEIA